MSITLLISEPHLQTAEAMAKEMNRNAGKIIDNVSLEEASAYAELRSLLFQMDISQSEEFQNRFSEVYGLDRKNISQDFRNRFFQFFEETKTEDPFPFREAYRHLYGSRPKKKLRSRQFAYLTFMANLINEKYPVFEKPVADMFDFDRPTKPRQTSRERLNAYLKFYEQIDRTYEQIMEEKLLHEMMVVLKIKLKAEGIQLPALKRLGLLIRSAGELKVRGALV